MSKRKCSAVDTLLTFCPPAPCARIAVHSISVSGMSMAIGSPSCEQARELAAADQLFEIGGAPDQHALDEDHRERRPAGPHLERVAAPPRVEVTAVFEILVRDAGGVERL